FGISPARTKDVEQQRRLASVEAGPEKTKILCVQLSLARHNVDRFFSGLERLAFGKGRFEIPLDRQAAAVVRTEGNALQIDIRSAAGVGVSCIQRTDLREQFVGLVAAGRRRGESKSIRQEH